MLILQQALSTGEHADIVRWHDSQSFDDVADRNFIRSSEATVIRRGKYVSLSRIGGTLTRSENWDDELTPLLDVIIPLLDTSTLVQGADFSTMIAPWRYGVGSAMSEHQDYTSRAAVTFVYWCGEEWDETWNGELDLKVEKSLVGEMIASPKSIAVAPLPNRLILFNSQNHHQVRSIEAPDGVTRRSITGMIVKGV